MEHRSQSFQAAYGSFLVIPLKYDPDTLDRARLERAAPCVPMTTMDLNENIKAMLDPASGSSVGTCYAVSRSFLTAALEPKPGADGPCCFRVTDCGQSFDFSVNDSFLYVFHTRVAFLCLSLSFSCIEALETICNPGWAHNPAVFEWLDAQQNAHTFSMENWLSAFLAPLGIRKFFDGDASYLLDAYAYILAVVPQWFQELDPMRRITFNLHKMMSPDTLMEDASEEDIRYVFAAKNLDRQAYRWGCCVASQTISYVVARADMDLAAEQRVQAEDGLPMVVLSLYEKYTCLRFTELITHLKKDQIKELKELMLNFQAFGTVTPASISRWHNVKRIYANLLEVNDIPAAVGDISSKLNILASHQQEIEHARSETVINIITLFGIVSILASVLSIVQILSDGDMLIWASTILTTIMLALVTALAVYRR